MVNKGFTIEEIDNKIHNCLEMQNLLPKSMIADEDKERGKREVYELGTVDCLSEHTLSIDLGSHLLAKACCRV